MPLTAVFRKWLVINQTDEHVQCFLPYYAPVSKGWMFGDRNPAGVAMLGHGLLVSVYIITPGGAFPLMLFP
jgi:hypothetical protein